MDKTKRSVAVLLRPDIRKIDFECTAGTERVAISDLQLLNQLHFSTLYCSAAQLRNWPTSMRLCQLFYPNAFLDLLNKASCSRNRFIRRTFAIIYFFATRVFEMLYVFQFIFVCRKFDYYYVFQVPLVGILAQKKTLVMCQDLGPRTFYFSTLFTKRFQQICFVFCSLALKKLFIASKPSIPENQLSVLHNNVDTDIFIKKSVGFNKRHLRLGYVGTWSTEKGINVLVDVVKRANQSDIAKHMSFIIAGDIDIWDRSDWEKEHLAGLQRKVLSLRKYRNVSIVGKIPYRNLSDFYQSIDYLLFPSVWEEPFGNVLIEAMSSGTPAIAFSIGATSEVIDNYINGIIVKTKTSRAFSQEIERQYLLGPAKRERLSNNAREKVLAQFSQSARAKKLLSYFQRIS